MINNITTNKESNIMKTAEQRLDEIYEENENKEITRLKEIMGDSFLVEAIAEVPNPKNEYTLRLRTGEVISFNCANCEGTDFVKLSLVDEQPDECRIQWRPRHGCIDVRISDIVWVAKYEPEFY